MPSAPQEQKHQTFKTLQAGRGFAAVLVVLVHLSVPLFLKFFGHKFWQGFAFGHAGVEYFFVISGFIIAYLHWQDVEWPGHRLASQDRLRPFLRKRFLRIYPVYWLVLIFVLPIYFTGPHFVGFHGSRVLSLLDDLTLLPTSHLPDLAVAWTLKHEIVFYAVFAVMIFNRRLGFLLAGVAALGSLAVLAVGSIWPRAVFDAEVLSHENWSLPLQSAPFILFNPLHLLFIYGAAIVWAVKRGPIPRPALLAALGVALFLGTGAYECFVGGARYEMLRSQCYGLGAAIAMTGFIELERSRSLKVPRFLCLLGDASYSLYLTHFALLSGLAKLAAHGQHKLALRSIALPDAVIFCALLVAAVAVGIVFHLYVEKPLLKRLSRKPESLGSGTRAAGFSSSFVSGATPAVDIAAARNMK
jgi:peptidoglycan/LPS O-acetylase OafA/YrhL